MSEFSRETLLNIIETDHVQCGEASALARMALAAMDSSESVELPLDYLQGHKDGLEWAARLAEANHPETGDWLYDDPIELAKAIRKGPDMPPAQPVADSEPDRNPVLAYADSYRDMAKQGVESVPIWSVITDLERNIAPLYRHAQQPVVPFGLHPDTQKLVIDFCTALAEKLYKAQLKYGYDADWKQDGWPSQCQAHFHQHIAKGDPRDVAAYCAFMWYHGWKTEAAQTAPVVTFYRDGIEAAAKWIDKQREAYDSEHGWSDPDTGAFEFGNDTQRGYSSTLEELAEGIRALHPNAGNSQTIPEGYVMVPMRLTAENGAKSVLSGEFSETQFVNCPECFGDDECETCDGSGRIEITVPVTWTTIKEIWAKGVEHFAAAPQEEKSE